MLMSWFRTGVKSVQWTQLSAMGVALLHHDRLIHIYAVLVLHPDSLAGCLWR